MTQIRAGHGCVTRSRTANLDWRRVRRPGSTTVEEHVHDHHRERCPQRRRRPDAVRHSRRGEGHAAARPVPVPGEERMGQRHPQPVCHPGLLRRRTGGHLAPGAVRVRRRPPRRARRIEPGPDAGGVPAARHRRVPHLGPGEHRRRPGDHPAAGLPRPSRATSTCSASSVCPTRSATATGRSACTSTSRATRRPSNWRRWWSGPASAPRSTTCSSTAPMSRSTSAPPDAIAPAARPLAIRTAPAT